MKRTFLIIVFLNTLLLAAFFSCYKTNTSILPEKIIGQQLVTQIDSFMTVCTGLRLAVEHNQPQQQLQALFLLARRSYKKIEWATEYFVPATARFINGPPVQEVELSGQTFQPAGLQVVESLLFPRYDTSNRMLLLQQLSSISPYCAACKKHFENIDILNWQVLDACKLEVFRVETLGITGFDNPLTLMSMNESAVALESLEPITALYGDKESNRQLAKTIGAAARYLKNNTGFDNFDRAGFIRKYCDSVSVAISILQRKMTYPVIKYNRLLNQEAITLSDPAAFNVNAYAPGPAAFMTPEKTALGKLLFADPMLSATGTRSCQSCHQPGKAFSDGLIKNTVLGDNKMLQRNTPTLLNAALQPSLFYDLRVKTLEDQSLTVVQNPQEMHGSLQLSVKKLWMDTMYRRLFSMAFPKQKRAAIDTLEVMNAIGSYVRSLTKLNSRFDEYMRGNDTALNTDEIAGFNIFMGKAKCATCHYMPLFNGAFPPRYMKIETEVIGVPVAVHATIIDGDLGRYTIIKAASLRHSFKTPTLRNAALTAPYMHNGCFNTLGEVVDFYNEGGGRGLGITIDNQTLPFDQLHLTAKEQAALVAFMKSLDSRE